MDEKNKEQNLSQQESLEEGVQHHRQAAQEGDARAQYELAGPITSTMSLPNPSIGGRSLRKTD